MNYISPIFFPPKIHGRIFYNRQCIWNTQRNWCVQPCLTVRNKQLNLGKWKPTDTNNPHQGIIQYESRKIVRGSYLGPCTYHTPQSALCNLNLSDHCTKKELRFISVRLQSWSMSNKEEANNIYIYIYRKMKQLTGKIWEFNEKCSSTIEKIHKRYSNVCPNQLQG